MPVAVPPKDDASAAEAAVAVLAGRAVLLHRGGGGNLMDCFAGIADPRSTRGTRHALSTILGLCTAAVLSGCVSLVEITDWVSHADQEVLGALDARRGPSGRYTHRIRTPSSGSCAPRGTLRIPG